MKRVRALLAVVALALAGQPEATADPCKADGQTCRRSRSCCGKSGNNGVCVKAAGAKFGNCCTRTTCAAQGKDCGTISDECGGTLECGSCTAPDTCGGGGTPNVCGTTTTTTTTTSTTTTTAPFCGSNRPDPECNGACPAGERCAAERSLDELPRCACFPEDATPCAMAGAPECGGLCLRAGHVCQAIKNVDLGVTFCLCVDVATPCGPDPDGCQAGVCAPGTVCAGPSPCGCFEP